MCVVETVRLSAEAYERLVACKHDDETFSEAVFRLTGGRPLREPGGVLDDEAADALRDAVVERRERRRADLESTAEQLNPS